MRQSVRASVRNAPRVSTMGPPSNLQLPSGAAASQSPVRLSVTGAMQPQLVPAPMAAPTAAPAPGPVRVSLVHRRSATGSPVRLSVTHGAGGSMQTPSAPLPRISTCSSGSRAATSPADSSAPTPCLSPASPSARTSAAAASLLALGAAMPSEGTASLSPDNRVSLVGASVVGVSVVSPPGMSPGPPVTAISPAITPPPMRSDQDSVSSSPHIALPRTRLSTLRESVPPRASRANAVFGDEPAGGGEGEKSARNMAPSVGGEHADRLAASVTQISQCASSASTTLALDPTGTAVDNNAALCAAASKEQAHTPGNAPDQQPAQGLSTADVTALRPGLAQRAARRLAPVSRSCILM
jgi:hypothetical protein